MISIFKIMNEFRITWFSSLCFLLLACGCTNVSSVCDNTGGQYKKGSSYEKNLRDIFKSLAIDVTLEDGFYNTTTGQDPDRVYALALCRKEYKTKDCYKCISTLSQRLTTECPNQTRAYSWDSYVVPCLVRYSDHPVSGSVDLDPVGAFSNTGDIKSNLTRFDEIWQSLMLRTLTAASAGTSKLKYYGTGTEKLTANETIYTFMQCTPDLSQSDCRLCLQKSVGEYQSCCYRQQGGVVARPSCVFRWDMYPFYGAFNNISTPSPPPPPSPPQPAPPPLAPVNNGGKKKMSESKRVILSVAIVVPVLLLILCFCNLRKRKNKRTKNYSKDNDELITADSLRFEIGTIRDATDNFSPVKELGRGGFGSVYKGTLWDGEEIAVKRLSKNSGQGDSEFKTEVTLVAKLQHRNLVRLLGFCLDGSERILVYEFVPNSSLDHFLFDPVKRTQLDRETRSRIIQGIALGLLYLHEDSRLRIIHRDLKAGNILLDHDMCPKIADFGLARLFGKNETQGSTNTIVGTYGYMAPEYAMHG